MWSSVTDLSQSAECFQGSSVSWHISKFYSFSRLNNIPLAGWITFYLSLHQLMNIWVVLTFLLLRINPKHSCTSFCVGIVFFLALYTGVILVCHMATLCSAFWGATKPFLMWLRHFPSPPAIYRFQLFTSFQHLLLGFLIVAIHEGGSWYLTMVLICISRMISDVEHIFTCLLSHIFYIYLICIFKYIYFILYLYLNTYLRI